jgi:hypothetical protein
MSEPAKAPQTKGTIFDHLQVESKMPDGKTVEVDKEIESLLQAVWQHGLQTRYSCAGGVHGKPGDPENLAMIMFEGTDSAKAFVAASGVQSSIVTTPSEPAGVSLVEFPSEQISALAGALMNVPSRRLPVGTQEAPK